MPPLIKKILIACYSYSGNTASVAGLISRETGGDLLEIQPVAGYPEDYSTVVEMAGKEISSGYRPPLKPGTGDTSAYGVIFAGSPNWCGTIAPPLASFLAAHCFAGRTVVPFCTHGGGGAANCFKDTANLCPGAKVLEGKAFRGSEAGESAIAEWVRRLDLAPGR